MSEEFKQAVSGDVVKFEEAGDTLEGIYVGYEESKQYPGSFAIKVKDGDDVKIAFASGIVIDLIKSNNIQANMDIKIVFKGMAKTKDGTKEYKTYEVFYK